jgi:hypothetical protein
LGELGQRHQEPGYEAREAARRENNHHPRSRPVLACSGTQAQNHNSRRETTQMADAQCALSRPGTRCRALLNIRASCIEIVGRPFWPTTRTGLPSSLPNIESKRLMGSDRSSIKFDWGGTVQLGGRDLGRHSELHPGTHSRFPFGRQEPPLIRYHSPRRIVEPC